MAQSPSGLELLLSCSICFEEFEENGDHVPRLLPCTHTLCEICIKQLIRDNKLQCPECKAEHLVPNKERSFPQNKYILTMVTKKGKPREEIEIYGKCEEHGNELSLFCTEEGCKKPICKKCLRTHKKHEVVEVEDENMGEINAKIEEVEKKLKAKVVKVNKMKNDVIKKSEACVEEIKREKDEVMKIFDAMITKSEKMKREVVEEIKKEVSAVGENLTLLRSLKSVVTELESLEDLKNKLKVVNEIERHLSVKRTYTYPEYQKNQAPREALCGAVMKTTQDLCDDVTDHNDVTTVVSASQLTCKVEKSLEFQAGWYNMALSDGSLVLLFTKDNFFKFLFEGSSEYVVKRLNLKSGGEAEELFVGPRPEGMAAVELGGRKTLALTFVVRRKILEFRDINNPNTLIHTHQVAPHEAGCLCVSSPSTLLYVDDAYGTLKEVHMLDCSGAEPKPVEGKNVIKTQLDQISDMCVAQDGDRELLVCADGRRCPGRLDAYDMDTGELMWSVEGGLDRMVGDMSPHSVTTDGRGQLFVADHNNKYVQMFHVADGRYLGALNIEGFEGYPYPKHIHWCRETLALVVSQIEHNGSKHTKISVISLKRE